MGNKKSTKNSTYFSEHRRITNKTRKLLKRIKNINPESQQKILDNCPIGRKREKIK